MTEIYVDADACPVREEVYRVAARLSLVVHVVHNGSRPIRPQAEPRIRVVTVESMPDAADDWIAERISKDDVCVTQDIPLASRCLSRGARALAANGRVWTGDNIGAALASRAIGEAMRSAGLATGGPAALTKQDRSRFLGALDTLVQAALRGQNA
jgi:uncharacterized protein YaiI (UPF0178 family)